TPFKRAGAHALRMTSSVTTGYRQRHASLGRCCASWGRWALATLALRYAVPTIYPNRGFLNLIASQEHCASTPLVSAVAEPSGTRLFSRPIENRPALLMPRVDELLHGQSILERDEPLSM